MNEPIIDFFDHIPSKEEKIEMRKTSKSPSEWLRLLCRDWAMENEDIVEGTDLKFLGYKSYLKGRLSSQLLCRLSIPELPNEHEAHQYQNKHVDFWGVLGIQDDFDKSYIISQIERFCALYSIRALLIDDDCFDHSIPVMDPNVADTEAAMIMSPNIGAPPLGNYLNGIGSVYSREVKNREREVAHMRRAADRAARDACREEKRKNKLKIRANREMVIMENKEAALARAADLVRSNRVPIEITRGAAAAQAAANAACAMMGVKGKEKNPSNIQKKPRSDIVVSTACDLDRIVTHAKNLWTKYNAIAKQHNQKVNWSTVAKELGIHVKVREKYARMHHRALQRGFDFKTCGHFKIKEHPHIFLEPLVSPQKIKLPIPDKSDETQQQQLQETIQQQEEQHLAVYNKDAEQHHHISDDQVAAAVDAAIKIVPVTSDVNCYNDAAATVDTVMNATATDVCLSVADATQAALAA
eukprot:CAMPEP_0203733784 /NCGR_PEP_ID=MMETSP0092-20131115/28130_1 /ASSEMBLY_ACC=CAM_ASM_001090 /TAXON_ID=426623 /ORGANISM="Chaetoceros affinis, Strain CCMP159" /LENGTH=468 /DNA_ID=CAMNT_0050617767 /DNA_START=191 /DNA_END=1594 /DNA_ORIENTATION=-